MCYHDYNVCTGKPIELVELAQMVRHVSGKNLEIIILKDGMNLEYTASNQRLLAEYPNIKYTRIEKAIKELYFYYESIKDTLDIHVLENSR